MAGEPKFSKTDTPCLFLFEDGTRCNWGKSVQMRVKNHTVVQWCENGHVVAYNPMSEYIHGQINLREPASKNGE